MGENKKFRKQIRSWLEQIDIHEAKITAELSRSSPDDGLVEKWRKEIRTLERSVAKVVRRLPGGRL